MLSENGSRQDIEPELIWSADVDHTAIAVKVTGGAVTVANDIRLRPLADDVPSDPEIARAAIAALKLELPISWENITPVVHQGRVALEGDVERHYQRERAESAMRRLSGVISVRNSLRVKPSFGPGC